MSACRGCGAPILWVRLPSGKLMPVDLQPSDVGNVAVGGLVGSMDNHDGTAVVLGPHDAAVARRDTPLHVSHFATCPAAGRFRR